MASLNASVAAALPSGTLAQRAALTSAASIPWYIWCAVLAITSVAIGANWDISWHMSIGRDTFWTPAHMAIYLCGLLAGVAFGYIVLSTTFWQSSPLAPASVHIWGFRAPLGAFIASWGGITMLTSAPFDNWWHDAYGLDVKIISPPHIVLFIGVYAVLLGTIVLIAGHMNRTSGVTRQRSAALLIYSCGIALIMMLTMLMEYTGRAVLHTGRPYAILAIFVPVVLAVAARATGLPFAATLTAALYTVFKIGLVLVLPLFPAEPKLGPVYQHVTHFIPEEFPLLLIAPAFVLDLLWRRVIDKDITNRSGWRLAGTSALVFVFVLLAVQWPFANFLMSPASRNAFFGTTYLWYGMPPTSHEAQNLLWGDRAGHFLSMIALAILFGTLSFRFGMKHGGWLRSIQR